MANQVNDDLFQQSTMSFGEHLEELRSALFRALIGLGIGLAIGLYFADQVVQKIQEPLKRALEDYYRTEAVDKVAKRYGGTLPPEIQSMVDAGFVPDDSMMIEPFRLLQRLERDYPDQFAFHFTPHKFVVDDIRSDSTWLGQGIDHGPPLAEKLVEAGRASGESPGKEMWELLSPTQQETLEELAEAKELTRAQRVELIGILNGLLEKPELHETAAFNELVEFKDGPTAKGVAELREKYKASQEEEISFSSDDSRRLNRFLISAYLSNYMRPPRVNIVEVPTWKEMDVRTIALNAQEAFMIWFKAALVAGAVFASPWMFWQVWIFVAAGLYPHERKYVWLYLPISLFLFLAGAALAFFFVFDPVLNFLFTFNRMMKIDPDPRIGEWLGFVLFLPIGFGISFQLPLVMLFLNRIGIFSTEAYMEKWRIAILVIFVISMLLTPADPVSMLLMAVPLTILYFSGVAMCRWMPKGRSPFDEAYEP